MSRLIIVIGDYSGGTAENTLKQHGKTSENLEALRTGDSADARVFNEIVRQNPDANHIITLPVARQFSPNSAGYITKEAIEWAFRLLENPADFPGYEDVTDISIVANVAPGVKSLKGNAVGQNGNNHEREAFISGTVSKGSRTINLGSTNAFIEGEGHTLGAVAELEEEGYTLSDFKAISGPEVDKGLVDNGQFRSRWALAYMARKGKDAERDGDDLLPLAREQHELANPAHHKKDSADAKKVFEHLKDFLPVRPGNAHDGFVTIISASADLGQTISKWGGQYPTELINGVAFDGNETPKDNKIIAKLKPAEQRSYRLTRQALLASNLANEFSLDGEIKHRTIVVDSKDSQPDGGEKYEVELKNGSRIITSAPEVLALSINSIANIYKNGELLEGAAANPFLQKARDFAEYLADKAVENDPYRNVKLANNFAAQREEILARLEQDNGNREIPDEKAVEITLQVKTGDRTENRTVYYVPSSSGGFGIWGHTKFSSGSTILGGDANNRDDFQAELFTPGCETAGNAFTVIPGVTSFEITQAKLVDKALLQQPSTRVTGENRVRHGRKHHIEHPRKYDPIHAAHIIELAAHEAQAANFDKKTLA